VLFIFQSRSFNIFACRKGCCSTSKYYFYHFKILF